jgi:ketosteroid isomerase-like protein
MSDSNIALAKRLYTLFGQGDIPGVLALFDPAIEWREAEGNPYQPDGAPWIGPDAVLTKLFMRIGADWDGFTVIPQTFTATEHGVLVEGRYTGTYKSSARALDVQMAHVLTMGGGHITRFQQYVDTATLQAVMTPAAS